MSTRTRSRPAAKPATARPRQQQRAAGPALPDWFTGRWPPAALAVIVELGHLAAALVEWPTGMPRGLAHVLIAAAFGVLAATVYFGQSWVVPAIGLCLSLALAIVSLAGALTGAGLYRELPAGAAAGLAAAELVLAGLFALRWRLDA
jgi:hypothetical protein